MTDRNVQYPYRFHVRPVPGTDDICEIIPAPGTVYEDGTFWNKQNVLKDATAALYGKTSEAVPDDIFTQLAPALSASHIADGTYTGTTQEGALTYDKAVSVSKQVLNLPFAPKGVIVFPQIGTGFFTGSTNGMYIYGGIALEGHPLTQTVKNQIVSGITVNPAQKNITVYHQYYAAGSSPYDISRYMRLNYKGIVYTYVAWG